MKKILILSHTGAFANFKIGSHHYANGLSAEGCDVHYIGMPHSLMHKILKNKRGGEYKLNQEVVVRELHTLFPLTKVTFWGGVLLNKLYHYFVSRKSDRDAPCYDAVICDYPFYHAYLDLFNYKKLIYRPTDNYISMHGPKVKILEKKIIDDSDIVIPTSDGVAKILHQTYGVPLEDMPVMGNGYDHTLFTYSKIRKKNGSVYIGAIDYRFDFDALNYLVSAFPNTEFRVYGPVSTEFLIRTHQMEEEYTNLRFMGQVPYSETPEIMAGAQTGLLLLNDHESNKSRSPMKLWEYAASGLNIIYSVVILPDEEFSFLHKYHSPESLIKSFRAALVTPFPEEELSRVKTYAWETRIHEMKNFI